VAVLLLLRLGCRTGPLVCSACLGLQEGACRKPLQLQQQASATLIDPTSQGSCAATSAALAAAKLVAAAAAGQAQRIQAVETVAAPLPCDGWAGAATLQAGLRMCWVCLEAAALKCLLGCPVHQGCSTCEAQQQGKCVSATGFQQDCGMLCGFKCFLCKTLMAVCSYIFSKNSKAGTWLAAAQGEGYSMEAPLPAAVSDQQVLPRARALQHSRALQDALIIA
jgi:hypothetical protein